MIRSMTGFAQVRAAGDGAELTVSVKAVNHRGLDIHFHTPPDFDPYENTLRAILKRKVIRGHLDVRVHWARTADEPSLRLNHPLLDAYLEAFKSAARHHRLMCEPDLNAAFRIPGMFEESAPEEPSAELEALITSAFEQALDQLNTFREREGAETAQVLRERNIELRRAVEEIGEIRGRLLPVFQTRLRERLTELLGGLAVDPQRVVQEAAILADRSDIGEEVARLRIHSDQLSQLLDAGGEVGKKLDFLLQEMNREANTVLSKTGATGEAGLRITELALAVKADVEKIREQALNLE